MTSSETDWSLYTTRFIGTSLYSSSKPVVPSNETAFHYRCSPTEEMQRRLTVILARNLPPMDIADMHKNR